MKIAIPLIDYASVYDIQKMAPYIIFKSNIIILFLNLDLVLVECD